MLLGDVDEQKEAIEYLYINPPGPLRVFNLQKRGVWAAWLGPFTILHHPEDILRIFQGLT